MGKLKAFPTNVERPNDGCLLSISASHSLYAVRSSERNFSLQMSMFYLHIDGLHS